MKQNVHELDFKRFSLQEFSHREVVEILQVTSRCLQDWSQRFFSAERGKCGRGDRGPGRRYSIADLICLAAFMRLSAYLGNLGAAVVAVKCAPLVLMQLQVDMALDDDDKIDATDLGAFLVVFKTDVGGYGVDLVARYLDVPNRTMDEWLAQHPVRDFVAISIRDLTMQLFARIGLVEEQR